MILGQNRLALEQLEAAPLDKLIGVRQRAGTRVEFLLDFLYRDKRVEAVPASGAGAGHAQLPYPRQELGHFDVILLQPVGSGPDNRFHASREGGLGLCHVAASGKQMAARQESSSILP